jgi:hypothetical protein
MKTSEIAILLAYKEYMAKIKKHLDDSFEHEEQMNVLRL